MACAFSCALLAVPDGAGGCRGGHPAHVCGRLDIWAFMALAKRRAAQRSRPNLVKQNKTGRSGLRDALHLHTVLTPATIDNMC